MMKPTTKLFAEVFLQMIHAELGRCPKIWLSQLREPTKFRSGVAHIRLELERHLIVARCHPLDALTILPFFALAFDPALGVKLELSLFVKLDDLWKEFVHDSLDRMISPEVLHARRN